MQEETVELCALKNKACLLCYAITTVRRPSACPKKKKIVEKKILTKKPQTKTINNKKPFRECEGQLRQLRAATEAMS